MKRLALLLLTCTLAASAGCGTAIKTAVNEARRSTGYETPLQNLDGFVLDGYREVYVEPFADPSGLGGPRILSLHVPKIIERLNETRFFTTVAEGRAPANEGALQVTGQILSVFRTDARSVVIGPKQMMLSEVTIVDAASGKVLGRAHIMGLALAETSNKDELATDGTAKGLKGWFEDHHTPIKE